MVYCCSSAAKNQAVGLLFQSAGLLEAGKPGVMATAVPPQWHVPSSSCGDMQVELGNPCLIVNHPSHLAGWNLLGIDRDGSKEIKKIYIYMPSTCCSLPAAEPLRSLGESCGAAGTSCQIACFQEGWQETGPLNPLGSPHPDLVCQCSFKFASSLLLYFIERSARWEHWQQLGQQSLFPVRRCPGAEAAARPVRKLSW